MSKLSDSEIDNIYVRAYPEGIVKTDVLILIFHICDSPVERFVHLTV